MSNARLRAQLASVHIRFHKNEEPTVVAQLKGHEYLLERGPLTEDDVARLTAELHRQRMVHTCLTCVHWQPQGEICGKYRVRPPAQVIAYGCPEWSDLQNGQFVPAPPVSLRR